ncbi:hypothetical protein A2U01_0108328, partial [Trifolium medium]|nr:hypothetical protein [Trifolium medium]
MDAMSSQRVLLGFYGAARASSVRVWVE